MSRIQSIVRVTLAAVAAAALTSCAPDEPAPNDFRYAEFVNVHSSHSHLALAQGFTEEEGLNFTSIGVPAGPDVIASLRSTSASAADAGNLAPEPVAAMIGAGDVPIIVGTAQTSNLSVRMVTFAGNGVTDDASTLSGKSIGVTLDTVGETYMTRLLASGGLTTSDVKVVNGRPSELVSALIRGDIEAAILWDPFTSQAQRIYAEQVDKSEIGDRGELAIYLDPELLALRIHVVTTADRLPENRENIVRMLRALIRTEAYIEGNRADAQTTVETWLGLETGDLTDFFDGTDFRVTLNETEIKADLNDILERLAAKQPSTVVPDNLDVYIDTSLLSEIDPDRVE